MAFPLHRGNLVAACLQIAVPAAAGSLLAVIRPAGVRGIP